jgi:copper chaperone CopZ
MEQKNGQRTSMGPLLVAAGCWWVPLFLMLLALTLESLAASPGLFRLLVAATAIVMVSFGFFLVYLRRPAAGSPDPARGLWRFNVIMMWITAAGVAAFVLLPEIGPASNGRRTEITRAIDIAPAVETASVVGASTKTFAVEGMTCQSCVRTVTEALVGVPGVLAADVDLEGATAVVSIAKGDAPPDSVLVEAVVDAGYKARLLERANDAVDAPDRDGSAD